MKRAPSCRSCVWLGLLVSGALHAAIAAVLLRTPPPSPEPGERIVALDLAMFAQDRTPAAVAPMDAGTSQADATATPRDEQPKTETTATDAPTNSAANPPPPAFMPTVARSRHTQDKARIQPKDKPAKRDAPVVAERKPGARAKPPPTPPPATRPIKSPQGSTTPRPGPSASTQAKRGEPEPQTAAARAASERAYLTALQRAIAREQRYPASARRQAQSGVATLAFIIASDGRIGDVRVAKSSGHSVLDQAAIQALGRLGRFRPIPKSLGRSSWSLQVPIRFDLE